MHKLCQNVAENKDNAPLTGNLYNELNLRHDHCRYPQVLNSETWTCDCPQSLIKDGDDCICEDCLFKVNEESYTEKSGKDLPGYLNSFLSQLDEEEQEEAKIRESSKDNEEIANRMLKKGKSHSKKKKSKFKIRTPKYGRSKKRKKIRQWWNRSKPKQKSKFRFQPYLRKQRPHLTTKWNMGSHVNECRFNSRYQSLKGHLNHINNLLQSLNTRYSNLDSTQSSRHLNPIKKPRVLIAKKEGPFFALLKNLGFGLRKKRMEQNSEVSTPKVRLKKIDWEKAKILNLKYLTKVQKLPKVSQATFDKGFPTGEEKGMSFTDTVVGNQTKGAVESGYDKAYGTLSNFLGSGSISLGAGEGSAAASAHTGQGLSAFGVESHGAKAFGMGMIGKKAYRGSSTTILLIGDGDAIATNTQSRNASASATALATKKIATAGSAAYGSAVAAASATPGKGSANGTAVFGDELLASVSVAGKKGPIAEAVAVGNPDDNLQNLLTSQNIHNSNDLQEKFFSGKSKVTNSDFDFLGLGADSNSKADEWFKK